MGNRFYVPQQQKDSTLDYINTGLNAVSTGYNIYNSHQKAKLNEKEMALQEQRFAKEFGDPNAEAGTPEATGTVGQQLAIEKEKVGVDRDTVAARREATQVDREAVVVARKRAMVDEQKAQIDRGQLPANKRPVNTTKVMNLNLALRKAGLNEKQSSDVLLIQNMNTYAKAGETGETVYTDIKNNWPAYREQALDVLYNEHMARGAKNPGYKLTPEYKQMAMTIDTFIGDKSGKLIDQMFGATVAGIQAEKEKAETTRLAATPTPAKPTVLNPGDIAIDPRGGKIAEGNPIIQKPVSVAPGGRLVDPSSGAVVAEGAPKLDQIESDLMQLTSKIESLRAGQDIMSDAMGSEKGAAISNLETQRQAMLRQYIAQGGKPERLGMLAEQPSPTALPSGLDEETIKYNMEKYGKKRQEVIDQYAKVKGKK